MGEVDRVPGVCLDLPVSAAISAISAIPKATSRSWSRPRGFDLMPELGYKPVNSTCRPGCETPDAPALMPSEEVAAKGFPRLARPRAVALTCIRRSRLSSSPRRRGRYGLLALIAWGALVGHLAPQASSASAAFGTALGLVGAGLLSSLGHLAIPSVRAGSDPVADVLAQPRGRDGDPHFLPALAFAWTWIIAGRSRRCGVLTIVGPSSTTICTADDLRLAQAGARLAQSVDGGRST